VNGPSGLAASVACRESCLFQKADALPELHGKEPVQVNGLVISEFLGNNDFRAALECAQVYLVMVSSDGVMAPDSATQLATP
jgi:hypothetical protein